MKKLSRHIKDLSKAALQSHNEGDIQKFLFQISDTTMSLVFDDVIELFGSPDSSDFCRGDNVLFFLKGQRAKYEMLCGAMNKVLDGCMGVELFDYTVMGCYSESFYEQYCNKVLTAHEKNGIRLFSESIKNNLK